MAADGARRAAGGGLRAVDSGRRTAGGGRRTAGRCLAHRVSHKGAKWSPPGDNPKIAVSRTRQVVSRGVSQAKSCVQRCVLGEKLSPKVCPDAKKCVPDTKSVSRGVSRAKSCLQRCVPQRCVTDTKSVSRGVSSGGVSSRGVSRGVFESVPPRFAIRKGYRLAVALSIGSGAGWCSLQSCGRTAEGGEHVCPDTKKCVPDANKGPGREQACPRREKVCPGREKVCPRHEKVCPGGGIGRKVVFLAPPALLLAPLGSCLLLAALLAS